jgi:hypothetical protein
MTHRKQRTTVKQPQSVLQTTDRTAIVYLALLSVAVVVCFFPLLTYFFAQDDFVLIHTAVRDGWRAAADFFAQTPGHFRPLTKAVYFGVMYHAFGLNPAPYHVVSIVVHLLNVFLVFLLMRRTRVSNVAALVTTTLFALSVAFFHVIAWISCIQQLIGQSFMLASLVWGLDYLRTGSARRRWVSLAAYALALCSAEQTFGVPVILLGYSILLGDRQPGRNRLRKTVSDLSTHLSLMLIYLVFIGVWKTAPREGYYVFSYGTNVLVNLATYVGWTLQFGVALPSHMATGKIVWGLSHVSLAVLVLYHLARRRWRETLFGIGFFVVTIAPTLFLVNHTFYLHTYIPVFGVLYLLALLLEDVLSIRLLRSHLVRVVLLAAVLVGVTAMTFVMVRRNEQYLFLSLSHDTAWFKRSFVLRRAEIARKMYNCLVSYRPLDEHVEKVYMVYGREAGRDKAKWNKDNVVAATGYGSLISLIYERPDMPVTFKILGDAILRSDGLVSDIYLFDDEGSCQRFEEE